MSITVEAFKNHLAAQLHGSTLNKVRNFEGALERAVANVLAKIDPIDSMRTSGLVQAVHDNVYNYSLQTDFKKAIDLIPQDNRTSLDNAFRVLSRPFDLEKAFKNKTISIEGNDGLKFMRINWRSTSPRLFNAMDSLTANGTWSVVGTASNLKINSLYKLSGSGSIEFNIAASGDGIQNTTMTALDLSTWDQQADEFMYIYLGSDFANLTSVNSIFGNDLTTKFWTCVSQTAQADGTEFRQGWNLIRNPWSSATQTGTVLPTGIDSAKVTFSVTAPMSRVRIDSITFSLGRLFDLKYYSKFLIVNSEGTWISRTTDDEDLIILDSEAINILIYETLIEAAQQVEGTDSNFDMSYATKKLYGDKTSSIPEERIGLYQLYRGEYPSQSKKARGSYFTPPNFRRK